MTPGALEARRLEGAWYVRSGDVIAHRYHVRASLFEAEWRTLCGEPREWRPLRVPTGEDLCARCVEALRFGGPR